MLPIQMCENSKRFLNGSTHVALFVQDILELKK